MNINIQLSEASIANAIRELIRIRGNIQYGLQQTIDILVKDAATEAQSAYGTMATVSGYMPDNKTGVVSATGEAVIIAEFGAGDATMPVMFPNSPGVDVYPGSYSEQVGSGEYADHGYWEFPPNSRRYYTEIVPKTGLYKARELIKNNAESVARGVIKL